MRNICLCWLLAGLAWPGTAVAQQAPPEAIAKAISDAGLAGSGKCKSTSPAEVVVCGRSEQRYRIDPQVLAATRAAEALPPKPELDASRDSSCTGPNCGGGTIPLVGMALTALKAAELAAQGDDWREAFRTHPDQYQLYQDAKAKEKRASVNIGVAAGNKPAPR